MQKILIYSTKVCPYCEQAKRLFSTLNYQYDVVSLDDKPELRQKISEENGGWRTVPMIFIGSEFIGGFADIKLLHDKGHLKAKVEA